MPQEQLNCAIWLLAAMLIRMSSVLVPSNTTILAKPGAIAITISISSEHSPTLVLFAVGNKADPGSGTICNGTFGRPDCVSYVVTSVGKYPSNSTRPTNWPEPLSVAPGTYAFLKSVPLRLPVVGSDPSDGLGPFVVPMGRPIGRGRT